MTTPRDLPADTAVGDKRGAQAPWLPLIIINVLAQLQMGINVSALPVSLGPISADLGAPATAAATALLLYSLFVAAFVMPGAKIGKLVLAGMPAVASAVTFVGAGSLATALSWRYTYWLIVTLAVVVLVLSFRLTPIPRQPNIRIDTVGVVLSATAIALILFGFNNLQTWGPLVAEDAAPFSILRLSPAPIFILVGIVLGQAFFAWSNRRVTADRQPLLPIEIVESTEEKSAVVAFLVAGSLGLAVGFLIPLYVQIVQGRTPLASAVAILPYVATIAAAGVLSVRLYDRFSPRSLGIASFILIAIGLVVVAFTLGNDWSTVPVILGLLLVGIGEGTLLTLLFNVLVSASPKRLAGDVGALRGVANNASNALGAAFASVLAVGLLGVFLASAYSRSDLPPELEPRALFHDANFVTNTELRSVLDATSATPEQVNAAVAINEDARLRALRASFLIVGAISLLSIFPSLETAEVRAG